MTEKECHKRIKTDYALKYLYSKNRWKAWRYFRCVIELMELARPGVKIILHHKFIGCTNYEEWNVNELAPMYFDEHRKLHQYGTGKYGVTTDDPMYMGIASKAWREVNLEKVKEYQAGYYEEHHEEILEKQRDRNKATKEERSAYHKKRYDNNSEHYRALSRRYRLANPQKIHAYKRKSYAAMKANETPEMRELRLIKDRERYKVRQAKKRQLAGVNIIF